MENRVNRSEIFDIVADKTGFASADVKRIYDSLIGEIVQAAVAGNTVVLNGFGSFYVQSHKGHPVRFESLDHKHAIDDYLVFKFSASHSMNDKLRRMSQETGE